MSYVAVAINVYKDFERDINGQGAINAMNDYF
jgi:hypothetical protein